MLTNLNFSYRILKNLNATVGSNNLFDVYPDPLNVINWPTPERYGTAALDNSSNGRFIYNRNTNQFVFNGGYYFLNLSASFQGVILHGCISGAGCKINGPFSHYP